jgi:hypothetical protein
MEKKEIRQKGQKIKEEITRMKEKKERTEPRRGGVGGRIKTWR